MHLGRFLTVLVLVLHTSHQCMECQHLHNMLDIQLKIIVSLILNKLECIRCIWAIGQIRRWIPSVCVRACSIHGTSCAWSIAGVAHAKWHSVTARITWTGRLENVKVSDLEWGGLFGDQITLWESEGGGKERWEEEDFRQQPLLRFSEGGERWGRRLVSSVLSDGKNSLFVLPRYQCTPPATILISYNGQWCGSWLRLCTSRCRISCRTGHTSRSDAVSLYNCRMRKRSWATICEGND